MTTHKNKDYKLSTVQYYLVKDVSQVETCKFFKCFLEKFNAIGLNNTKLKIILNVIIENQ